MLARSVAWNLAGQVTTLALGFVTSVALARWLGPSDRGLLGVLSSFVVFAYFLGGIGVPMAVMYYAARPEARPPALLGNTFLLAAALAVVLVPVTWALRGPLADAFTHGRGEDAWVVAAALVPVSFLDYATQNQLLGRLRFGYFNVASIVARIVSLAAVFTFVVALDGGVVAALVATILAGSGTMLVWSLREILPHGRPRLDLTLLRSMLAYGARVQVGSIFQTLNYRLDVVVLQFFRPLSEVGYYVVAQIVAELAGLVASSFQNSVLPLVARAGEEDRAETTALGIRHHGIAALCSLVVLAVLGPAIILFAYGDAYRKAVVPMLILLPAMWFSGTGTVVAGDLRGRGRPGLSSLLSGIAVVVTVVLDVALIPPFGVIGAAIASVVAYVTYGSLSLVAVSRLSGLPLRGLVVPTRADLRAYPLAARRVWRRVTG